MSNNPPPDTTIKIPIAVTIITGVVLLIAGTLMIELGKNLPAGTTIGYLLFSLFAALVTFSICGAAGEVRSGRAQLGGSAAIFVVTLIILLKANPVTIPSALSTESGVVFKGDRAHAVVNAIVTVQGPKSFACVTDGFGHFSFVIPAEDSSDDVFIFAAADKVGASTPKKIKLEAGENLEIDLQSPMDPLANISRIQLESRPAIRPPPLRTTSLNEVTGFYFLYKFDPPGRRDWTRDEDGTWNERYPDGRSTVFSPKGRATVDGANGDLCHSTVEDIDVFIPDRGSKLMWARFRRGVEAWGFLGEMLDIR